MTWTAAAMAAPAVLGLAFIIVRTAVATMGWCSTSLIAAGIVTATIVMDPVLALGMVSSALMVVFPASCGIMRTLGQSQKNATRTR